MLSRSRAVVAACAASLVVIGFTAAPGSASSPKRPATPGARPSFAGLADANHNGIADGLDRRLNGAAASGRLDVVATFADRASMRASRSALAAGHVSATFQLIDGFAASLTAGQIRSLAARPGVIRVEQNFRVHALDDAANNDFGATGARADFGVTGAGTEICIPDSGVDLGHEQLDSKKPIGWLDLIGNKSAPYDDMGHGTKVASIALGDGVGSGPIVGLMQGVAPQAALSAVKVLDWTGYGDDSLSVQAVQWCAQRSSVDVISLSVGSDVPSDGLDALSQAVDAAVADGKIVVAAAGNSGDVSGSITSPGSAKKAITVGAAADRSANPAAPYYSQGPYLAPFSSRGPTSDGRTKPDIVGPGVTIGAALAGTTATYEVSDGTSFSTPYVAGIAALVRQLQPSWTQTNVRSAIEGNALDAGPTGKDNDWGAGLLDGYAAVAQAAGATGSTPFPVHERFTGTAANNGSWSKTFTLGAGELNAPIAITVTEEGSLTCIYDLGPLGCFLYGWSPDLEAALDSPGGFALATSTCPAGNECTYGRQETLHVMPTQTGTYTIRVYPAADGDGSGGSFAVDLFHGPVTGGSSSPPPPPPPPTLAVHVGDLDPNAVWVTNTRWRARATIETHDQNHEPIAGVIVTGVWTGNKTAQCITNANGRCQVSKRYGNKKASVTFSVTTLQLSGYTYEAIANHDPDGDSDGTAITVTRPA
jgi:serine protease AprX